MTRRPPRPTATPTGAGPTGTRPMRARAESVRNFAASNARSMFELRRWSAFDRHSADERQRAVRPAVERDQRLASSGSSRDEHENPAAVRGRKRLEGRAGRFSKHRGLLGRRVAVTRTVQEGGGENRQSQHGGRVAYWMGDNDSRSHAGLLRVLRKPLQPSRRRTNEAGVIRIS